MPSSRLSENLLFSLTFHIQPHIRKLFLFYLQNIFRSHVSTCLPDPDQRQLSPELIQQVPNQYPFSIPGLSQSINHTDGSDLLTTKQDLTILLSIL